LGGTNSVLQGLTEVLVSTNGAVVTTESLASSLYTIAQPLLHDPDLEGADGGFVKKGAKPIALTGANTYTGDTVVEEGTLVIPAAATSAALPASSAVVVADGATLEMASGTAARVGGLRFDMDTAYGTLAGFAPAAEGTLYVTGVGETQRKGLVLPGTVTDAQHASKLTRWAVYVDGDLDDSLSAFVRNGRIVLDGKPGMYLIIR
jgi:autotransporter-associated beta strand protein